MEGSVFIRLPMTQFNVLIIRFTWLSGFNLSALAKIVWFTDSNRSDGQSLFTRPVVMKVQSVDLIGS